MKQLETQSKLTLFGGNEKKGGADPEGSSCGHIPQNYNNYCSFLRNGTFKNHDIYIKADFRANLITSETIKLLKMGLYLVKQYIDILIYIMYN